MLLLSSRRRHTRFDCDWSSDVCSSDLVLAAGAGAWLRLPELTLRVSANLSHVGDTSYTDVESSARTAWGQVTLDATLGARVWSRGGGRGMYGETSAALSLGERIAIVLSGGRYPTDPISGKIGRAHG